MLQGLPDQNVVSVQRINTRKGTREFHTKHMVLTFNTNTLPDSIEVGYPKVNIQPYIPSSCDASVGRGSATAQSCGGRKTCVNCASKDHVAENCDAAPCCPDCEDEHVAHSRACPSWKKVENHFLWVRHTTPAFRSYREYPTTPKAGTSGPRVGGPHGFVPQGEVKLECARANGTVAQCLSRGDRGQPR